MKFQITPAAPPISEIVYHFWEVDRKDPGAKYETILPKGSVEIIFNLDESQAIPAAVGDTTFVIPRCFISGHNTIPIDLQVPVTQLFFGVYMKPTALRSIFRVKGEDFANRCTDLTLIDQSFNTLWHQLADQKCFTDRVMVFTKWMQRHVPVITKQEILINNFLSADTVPLASADEVANALCYSPRHLSRKLYELSAMNLERTIIYKRYIRSINLMHHSSMSLTEIAHACNFSDQSHFSKVFRSYTGMRPSAYRKQKSDVFGHVYENVR